MASSADIDLAILVFVPFAAAMLAPLVHRLLGAFSNWVLALVPAAIFISLLGAIEPIAAGEVLTSHHSWIATYDIDLVLRLDGLSLLFALAISGIGTLITLYAGGYLRRHPDLGRFYAFILLFLGAMLGLVLADNMVALFVFWELTSIASFLLIGFDHTRQAARRAAIQALVVTGAGGLLLLAGLVLIHGITGGWSVSNLAAAGLQQHPAYGLVLGLVLCGAFTKSAQFPFHFWLPNAMEAPTPVSAFLHSATMVQAGVYLLARFSTALGDTAAWSILLSVFGGLTLIWGAVSALRQTDLKQMLAQTTLASLGICVLLLGTGGEMAALAVAGYFLAHALYKAGLFLVVGTIDHETGIREITVLSGLWRRMPVTFLAAVLMAVSMLGLPLTLGFFGKEEMYRALFVADLRAIVPLFVLIVGNGAIGAVGLLVALRPFLGPLTATPKAPHEAWPALLLGPVVLASLGIALAIGIDWTGLALLQPAANGIVGATGENHLSLGLHPANPILWLSVLTWIIAIAIALKADLIRTLLRRLDLSIDWSFDKGFDQAMFGLIRGAWQVTRTLHHGRLEIYLVTFFLMLALAVFGPLLTMGGLPRFPGVPQMPVHEWAIMLIALAGVIAVPLSPQRLTAVLALGVQGFAVALIFLAYGAPDLAFTQFMVEVLSVVILALVMTRLRLDQRDPRVFEDIIRDGGLALACGVGVALLLMVVQASDFDGRLSAFFTQTSVPLAHGHNVVNVIIVDYRGLDTLGEISVVMAAGIAIYALIRKRRKPA